MQMLQLNRLLDNILSNCIPFKKRVHRALLTISLDPFSEKTLEIVFCNKTALLKCSKNS